MQLLKYYQGVLNKPTTYKLEETNKRQIKKEGYSESLRTEVLMRLSFAGAFKLAFHESGPSFPAFRKADGTASVFVAAIADETTS